VAGEGAEAMRDRVERAVPFASFQVERILSRADVGSAEGRDRAVRELRPVIDDLPPGLLRDGLMQRVAGMLALKEGQLGSLFARGRRTQPAQRESDETRPRQVLDPEVRKERDFLVLCIALPDEGSRALEQIDFEEHITSMRLRRAARHLAGRIDMPMTAVPPEDEELARVLADLVERAGRVREVRPEHLEQQRLYLELGRLERAIRRARVTPGDGSGGPRGGNGAAADSGSSAVGDEGGATVHRLALEREQVRAAIQELDARLEKPV
jgi:DNA primase